MVQLKDAIEKFRDGPEGLEELVEALAAKFAPENAMLLLAAMEQQSIED